MSDDNEDIGIERVEETEHGNVELVLDASLYHHIWSGDTGRLIVNRETAEEMRKRLEKLEEDTDG